MQRAIVGERLAMDFEKQESVKSKQDATEVDSRPAIHIKESPGVEATRTDTDARGGATSVDYHAAATSQDVKARSADFQSASTEQQKTGDSLSFNCGEYKLVSVIGQGGMGTVYKARHPDMSTEFAIKVVHPELVMDEVAMKRFQAEARAATRLSHANLVTVYDQGETEMGVPFLVMDLVKGKSLDKVLKDEGFLDVPTALNIFCQICDALQHAHQNGVIHRDLKPSNIIVAKGDGGVEIVKVVDFGIAKLLGPNSADTTSPTQSGDVFGSPSYMSPEQCLGLTMDMRSDVYSMGCIMYECLTGLPAFAGANAIQTMMKQIEEPAPSLGTKFQQFTFPFGLEQVVQTALEKDPRERYQSIDELRVDLQRLREGKMPTRTRLLPKPKKMVGPIGAFAGAVTVLALIAYAPQLLGSLPQPSRDYAKTFSAYIDEQGAKNGGVMLVKDVPQIPDAAVTKIVNSKGADLYTTKSQVSMSELIARAVQAKIDLTDANFSNCRIHDIDLEGAMLQNADFSHAKIENVTFGDGTNLGGARFVGATITGSTFLDSSLAGANFNDAILGFSQKAISNVFSNCDLDKTSFENSQLIRTSFKEATHNTASFVGADLIDCEFVHCDISAIDFNKCYIARLMLGSCTVMNNQFPKFSNVKFDDADVRDEKGHEF